MEHSGSIGTPDVDAIRNEALLAGAIDPFTLRFQIVEYDKHSGEKIGVPCDNIGLSEAIARTARMIENRQDSHFCLEPVGFIQ